MLLGIPSIISGDLLKVLNDMGHGDEIVIADANFPAYRCGERVVQALGLTGTEMMHAILRVMPLDHLEGAPATLMAVAKDDDCETPSIWTDYSEMLSEAGRKSDQFRMLERDDFYKRASKAYAVVQTGETALYGNIILRKGVVRNEVLS